jgi:hypothetical protein
MVLKESKYSNKKENKLHFQKYNDNIDMLSTYIVFRYSL